MPVRLTAEHYLALLESLLAEGLPVTARVRGYSMLPEIPDGACVRVEPLPPNGPRPGEVVVFKPTAGGIICHRVQRRWETEKQVWVQTWGDSARVPDTPVTLDNVVGIVTALEQQGHSVPLRPRPRWRLWARALKHRLLQPAGSSTEASSPAHLEPGDDG